MFSNLILPMSDGVRIVCQGWNSFDSFMMYYSSPASQCQFALHLNILHSSIVSIISEQSFHVVFSCLYKVMSFVRLEVPGIQPMTQKQSESF